MTDTICDTWIPSTEELLAQDAATRIFPLAKPACALEQYYRLQDAKEWLARQKLHAMGESEFVYKRATGSVLGEQR